MTARLEFDLNDPNDSCAFDEVYHAQEMATALWEIRNMMRRAEKNDETLDDLTKSIREIMSDLPESIIG